MEWLQFIQTVLLVVLVDRQLILRDRYIIRLKNTKPIWNNWLNGYLHGCFSIWIYCKKAGRDNYTKDGGKLLLSVKYNKTNKRKG